LESQEIRALFSFLFSYFFTFYALGVRWVAGVGIYKEQGSCSQQKPNRVSAKCAINTQNHRPQTTEHSDDLPTRATRNPKYTPNLQQPALLRHSTQHIRHRVVELVGHPLSTAPLRTEYTVALESGTY
jgi:hypothetical protein